jgi:hypothetical protein
MVHPMSRFRPRLAGALLVFLLILLAADYGGWLWLTGRMREGYAQWQTTLAADGWQVTSAAPIATGWPLAAQLQLDQPRLAQAEGGFAWSAARATFGISILHPRSFVIVPQGAQSLTAAGWAPLRFHATTMRIAAPLGAPVQRGVADAAGLNFGTPIGAITIKQIHVQAQWEHDDARGALTAESALLPAGRQWGLGDQVQSASLLLDAHGHWPGGHPAVAAAAWRDGGGLIELRQFDLHWGALAASATGEGRLNAALQPEARAELVLTNPQAALNSLADAGVIPADAAKAAGAVLQLLSMSSHAQGAPNSVTLPLRLKDGTATVARIPLARVAKLKWQGAETTQ